MKILFILPLFLFLFCHSNNVFAESDKIDSLAHSPTWLALLHINARDEPLSSYVDDQSFFLSADGATNPANELLATYKAITVNANIQCKYPARNAYLLKHFPKLETQLPDANCEEYEDWLTRLNTFSVVLVFASAQLNSPSSMYGHTFLRFDPKNVEEHSTYLSYALNFGATVPDDAGGFSYALRGLTGGYPGNFAANPYFEKIKEYNQLENRDLWEYTLNLNQSEIDFMLAHMWELKGVNFDYFFFDENCSFRLLELLDVARPNLELVKEFTLTTMPLDTIRTVKNAGLITDVHYRASIMTKLETQLAMLSNDERDMVLQLSENIEILNNIMFLELPEARQQLIVDSAYRYLRYQNTFNGRKETITKRSFSLLKALNQYNTTITLDIETPHRPDEGHKSTMWSVSAGQNDAQNYLQLQYRGSFHDLIDPPAGYYSGMSLNMMDLELRYYEDDKLKLEKAELFNIISLSNRNKFFSPWSWKANVSLEQQWTDGKERLIGQVTGGGGLSYQPINNSYLFLMATARLEFNKHLKSYASIAPGLHVGFVYNWQHTGFLIEAEHYQFLFDQSIRTQYSFQQSFHFTENMSVRFALDYHDIDSEQYQYDFTEYRVEFRQYF